MLSKEKYNSFFLKNSQNIVILLTFLFITFFYSPLLFHPSKYIFNNKRDAVKNYYSYEWHVQNDTSMTNFTGTNYPYGELHAYTDGTPLLSDFIRVFSFLKPYSIPIFNLTLLLSFIFCSILLFRIFEEFKVPKLLSVISSVGITILCPQAFRLSAHFALSYSFAIPLIIYLLILFENRNRKNYYTFLIALSIVCLLFIHQYLGMICSSLVVLYWVIRICCKLSQFKKLFFSFIFQAFFPILLYMFYLKITDTHSNRTSNPYGFLYFTSNIETVFISTLPPLRHVLSLIYKITIQNWEGIAYVGISTTITFLYLPFLLFKKRNSLKPYLDQNTNEKTLVILGVSSFFLLLFSMGYPFKWNMEWLLEYFAIIKQFRAPGRFAWVFYFVATIFSTIVISRYFFVKLPLVVRSVICGLILLMYAVEGLPYHNLLSKNLIVKNCFNPEYVDYEIKTLISAANKTNAQAIIPLPAFHVGTDYYHIPGSEKILTSAFTISFHTKIPLMANLTPRTSLTEAESLIQVLGNNLLEKDLEKIVNPTKPFLILYSKENLTEEENSLLAKGHSILETENYILKEVSPKELFLNEVSNKISFYKANHDRLILKNTFLLTDSSYFEFKDFDLLDDKKLIIKSIDTTMLFEIPENNLENGENYQISFWCESKDLNANTFILEKSQKTNSSIIIADRNINTMPNLQNHKTLAILTFKADHPENKYAICLKKDKESRANFIIDNLMIKRKDVDVYKMLFSQQNKDSLLIVNNFLLPLK